MRVVILLLCVATLHAAAALAQTAPDPSVPSGPLSLEQVLQIAESRSESIAIARTGIRHAEGEEVRARAALFPQVTASASYDRSLASEYSGLFNNASTGSSSSTTASLPFGQANVWRMSLAASQNLFDFGRIRAQRAQAAVAHTTADLALTGTRAQLLFEVTQAYYNAALSDRLVAIAEATVTQATATLQQAEAGFRAGTQPEFDVLRARVSRDTLNPNVIRQRVNRDIALLHLKQLLDLPADYDLRVSEDLGAVVLPPAPMFATRVTAIESAVGAGSVMQVSLESTAPVSDRAAVKDAAISVQLREAALDAVKAQRMPSVAVTSNYGRVAYPSNIVLPTFDRTNWTVGVNVQMPILTGGRQRGGEMVAQADLDQTRVRLRQVQELAALDTRTAWAELIAARAAWEATAGTVEQAGRAFELAGIRYQAGVSTQLELSDARLLLQLAEANRAQAARDLQIARARVALLPDLPLGQPVSRP